MDKEDYRQTLRSKLKEAAADERARWCDRSLLLWWVQVTKEDSYLRWGRSSGDPWQHVPGFCEGLYGGNC